MRLARGALAFVGIVAIVLALGGFWYNFASLTADFSQVLNSAETPYFRTAFYVMSAICIACYALLLYIGIQMIRGKTDVTRLLVLLLAFEVLYFFFVGFMWTSPEYGLSIGAATGVANGGLMFQALTLFPLWAPVIAFLASRSLSESPKVLQTQS